MKIEIKFRAWIPKLGIMLENITLYGDGMMGYDSENFELALPPKYELNDDGVYHKDFDNGNDIFEEVMSILPGEDWIWLEKTEFEPMQSIGLKDKTGKSIFEGDIVDVCRYESNDMWQVIVEDIRNIPDEFYGSSFNWSMVVGNIYQNKFPI